MPREKILIVEDEAVVALNLERRIEQLGYQSAGICFSGEEAVQRVLKLQTDLVPPDLILMDIKLAGAIDGVEAANIIHQTCEAPIVFLTAYSDDLTLTRAKKSEPFGYLTKPVQDDSIKSTIEISLSHSRIKQRLSRSEKNFKEFFKMSPAGSVIMNAHCVIIDNNSAFAWLLGTLETTVTPETNDGGGPHDLKGVDLLSKVEPTDRQLFSLLTQAFFIGQTPETSEFRLLRKDGLIVWVEAKFARIDMQGGSDVALMVCTDITFRKNTEAALRIKMAELKISNEKLDQFAATASHDLRAPARTWGLYVFLLAREYGNRLDEQGHQYLQYVLEETKRMQKMVDDLLDYSRLKLESRRNENYLENEGSERTI